MSSIVDIKKTVSKLNSENKELFNRIYSVSVDIGELEVPKKMHDWVKKTFGSVKEVKKQKIVRVNNNIILESALFNELRSKRPIEAKADSTADEEIEKAKDGPFCTPRTGTPKDVFGRLMGDECQTASNIAKYDKWHGLIVFNDHNPLSFNQKKITDYLETAQRWMEKAHKKDKKSVYPMILWHCLWRSAASIVHGHMQLLLTRNRHYTEYERLNRARQEYTSNFGTDYFDDWFKVHKSLGLGLEYSGVKVLCNLTPRKEKEVVLISKNVNGSFARALGKVLQTFRDDLGVQSFTVGIGMPPLEHEEGWEGFPVIARIVDRGPLSQKTADIGAMELIAQSSVVASDPWQVFKKIKKRF